MSSDNSNSTANDLSKKILESMQRYVKLIDYMGADLPIETLCLPKKYERVLLSRGYLRIYELFDVNLTEIEGLSEVGIRHLTSSLDKFLPIS